MNLQKRTGVALWRQIADEIRRAAPNGLVDNDGRLPGEHALAERFGVNRHTVRAAIAALANERCVEIRHGKGTYFIPRRKISYPIGRRTRFAEGVRKNGSEALTRLLSSKNEIGEAELAARLGLDPQACLLRMDTISSAGDEPISVSTHWFDGKTFKELPRFILETGSITLALKKCGIDDYLRKHTSIEARHANDDDLDHLRLSPGAIVLVTHAANARPDGAVFQISETRFAADKVTLDVDYMSS